MNDSRPNKALDYYRIKSIKIPNESYTYIDYQNKSSVYLDNLSKMNLFIGENNSGKSLFIRELFSKKDNFKPSYQIELLNTCMLKFLDEIKKYSLKIGFTAQVIEKDLSLLDFKPIESIDESINDVKKFIELEDKITTIYINDKNKYYSPPNVPFPVIGNELIKIYKETYKEFIEKLDKEKIKNVPTYKRIYVPVLRGLRPIATDIDYSDLYQNRTREIYFSDLPGERIIYSGLQIYTEVRRHLLGTLKMRRLIGDYQKYLSENFFENKEVIIIPADDKKILTVKIGSELERPIYDLGDGVESIIIITFPLFINKYEYVLFYIDEPEKFLHPSLQRKLIDTLLNEDGFEHFQYYITTHSNHFLDLTLDFPEISIFSVKKDINHTNGEEIKPKFRIENLSFGDRNALSLLGVRNSSVFLSNCTIWVEGITDRFYYKKYLEIYIDMIKNQNDMNFKQLREDYHYSFVEYSGGNITHWSFLENGETPINVDTLCGKIFLIADNDNDSKKERHELLQKKLGDRYYRLNCKEVENLLSPRVLTNVLRDYKETEIPVLKYIDYKDANLGDFLDKILINKKRKGSYANGNTITDKNKFCQRALNHIENWEDLTNEAKDLTKRIYEFIKTNN